MEQATTSHPVPSNLGAVLELSDTDLLDSLAPAYADVELANSLLHIIDVLGGPSDENEAADILLAVDTIVVDLLNKAAEAAVRNLTRGLALTVEHQSVIDTANKISEVYNLRVQSGELELVYV